MSTPPLAVVMPVCNAAPYLDASVQSILGQTFGDFEFVVFDDGSTDGSSEILRSWARRDRRLRVERSDKPSGPVKSSNMAVRASTAPLVARMDADDVSHPERLERQIAILRDDPRVVLIGTLFEGIDDRGHVVRPRDRWRLLWPSPFAPFPHGSVAFRRAAFEDIGGYLPDTEFWEDLSLFRRLADRGRVLVVPDALYQYRFHSTNVRLVHETRDVEIAIARMRHAVGQSASLEPAEALQDPHVLYSLAASRLWAGHSTELLARLRMTSLSTPTTLAIFLVAVAAAVSPVMTRGVLGRVITARDWAAGFRIASEPFEWHFA